MITKDSAVGIVCCSNGLSPHDRTAVENLKTILETLGLVPVFSPYLYGADSPFSGSGRQRAHALMEFYKNPEIKAVFDISGGDMANEILPYLDFDIIKANPKLFWGYSDLTVILNAIYAKTGLPSVLYQIRNLTGDYGTLQQALFSDTVLEQKPSLYDVPFSFVQGTHMEGVVVGGNIRCFLKLAGTEFFPELHHKLLFLEARSGRVPQMVTYLSQLQMMGVFQQIDGVLLGTFSQMEREGASPDIISLVRDYAGDLPIAKTQRIGHGEDSMGLVIGGYKSLTLG